MPGSGVTIRTFRDGDEQSLAALRNQQLSGFVGPSPVTPQTWRAQYDAEWRGPVLEGDSEAFRVAERGGQIVGYAVCECPSHMMADLAVIQELCVAKVEDAGEIARALAADAEQRARAAGVPAIIFHTSAEDGLTSRLAEELGYLPPPQTTGVFMAAVTDLAAFLSEIAPELSRRLAAAHCRWQGVLELRSASMTARLQVKSGKLAVSRGQDSDSSPAISAQVAPDALPLLLFGRMSVGDAYLQDAIALTAANRAEALELLDTLFPRMPIYLPRSQWW
jgi:predicted N-acetyltransferase YhbS